MNFNGSVCMYFYFIYKRMKHFEGKGTLNNKFIHIPLRAGE